MSASGVDLGSTPLARSTIWTRLALLAAALLATFALAALVVAWLVPSTPSRTATYPLAALEVGVPEFYRPFEMGRKGDRLDGIWLVRQPDESVRAFWSRPAHPVACAVQPASVEVPPPPPAPGVRPTPTAKPGPPGGAPPAVAGFREPCLGSAFLIDGTRVFGPPPRGLDSFPTTVERGTVTIDLGTFILGRCTGSGWTGCSEPGHPRTARSRIPAPDYSLR